jgi:hypothetical protein
MAYEAILGRPGLHRVLLEQYSEGVYLDVFESPGSESPCRDYFQPDLLIALKMCEEDYGLRASDFRIVPDERRH